MVVFCELRSSIKGREFVDPLNNYQLLKKTASISGTALAGRLFVGCAET
jgi:hypothetical protein